MQKHWTEWGPPPYIPIAGYFGISGKMKGSKPGSRKSSRSNLPEKPSRRQEEEYSEEKSDLRDLLKLFPGGRI